jgi:hypothetical protein
VGEIGRAPDQGTPASSEASAAGTSAFCGLVLAALETAQIPFLVGGTHAFAHYTDIARGTKDFDIFVHPRDVERVMETLSFAGCDTELAFPHWLAKASTGEDHVDVIFGSGNGVAGVDGAWFDRAVVREVFGIPVRLCPVEEMIWSKAFVMERERYDGADIVHLLRAQARTLDWPHLLRRFGPHWRVLLAHLVLFGFVYPTERTVLPGWVMRGLLRRMRPELQAADPGERVVSGDHAVPAQYLVDIEEWAYVDARLAPQGNMTEAETARWTAAIEEEQASEETAA